MRVTKKVEGFILEEVKKCRAGERPEVSKEVKAQEAAIKALSNDFVSQISEVENRFCEAVKAIVGDENDVVICRSSHSFYHEVGIDVLLRSATIEKKKEEACTASRKYDKKTSELADELCARMEMGGDWETLQQLLSEI